MASVHQTDSLAALHLGGPWLVTRHMTPKQASGFLSPDWDGLLRETERLSFVVNTRNARCWPLLKFRRPLMAHYFKLSN